MAFGACCYIGRTFTLWSVDKVTVCAALAVMCVAIVSVMVCILVSVVVLVIGDIADVMAYCQPEGIHSSCGYFYWELLFPQCLPGDCLSSPKKKRDAVLMFTSGNLVLFRLLENLKLCEDLPVKLMLKWIGGP